jgi:hypothetical protein
LAALEEVLRLTQLQQLVEYQLRAVSAEMPVLTGTPAVAAVVTLVAVAAAVLVELVETATQILGISPTLETAEQGLLVA